MTNDTRVLPKLRRLASVSMIVFTLFVLSAWGPTSLVAQCVYSTVAGPSVTFRGDGVAVSGSIFNSPQAIAAAPDGSIYVADSGNNRVRKITPDGIIRTVAGTGQPGFSGDGGSATKATLRQPAGLALGADGTVFVADTGNNRVRVIRPDGVMLTLAGEGHARFGGDGGPAVAASLNRPTSLAPDAAGNLYVVDSVNGRVRRIAPDGGISTFAGTQGTDDYFNVLPPGAAAPTYVAPYSIRAGTNGNLYISDAQAVHQIDKSGNISNLIVFSGGFEQPITAPTALTDLKVSSGIPIPLSDGSLVLGTKTQTIRIANGSATPLGPAAMDLAADSSVGGVLLLTPQPSIQRLTPAGTTSAVYSYSPPTDPALAASAFELDLRKATSVAVAPDGTIYVAATTDGEVIVLKPGGQVSTLVPPSSPAIRLVAVDSKGNVFGASPLQIFTISPNGTTTEIYSARSVIRAMRFDAQDRLYVFQNDGSAPLVRLDPDGSKTIVMNSLTAFQGLSYIFNVYEPMAVAQDGTIYLNGWFANVGKLAPGTTAAFSLTPVPLERIVLPVALAVTPSGDLFIATQGHDDQFITIYKVTADGTLLRIFGGDHNGFWNEHGYDSAPQSGVNNLDLIADNQGDLLTIDRQSGSLRRISTSSCVASATPTVNGVVEAATGNQQLKLAAGQVFSLYGSRLGPSEGVVPPFDDTGHLPILAGGTSVTVNDIPAPLLYVGAGQINAIVPFDLAGQQPVRIVVTNGGLSSNAYSMQLGNYGPAIFNYAAPNNAGRYVFMQNSDGTINSPSNPAKLGTIVTVLATGTGATDAAGEDGARSGFPLKRPIVPVRILVEDEDAPVAYAGTAPTQVEGVTQINFRLPNALPGGGPSGSGVVTITMGAGVPLGITPHLLFYFTS